MTIAQLIEYLTNVKEDSPLGWDTVVYVCVPGIEYQDIKTVAFIPADDGGTISLGIEDIPLDCEICRDPDYVAGSHPLFDIYEYEGGAYR